MYYFLKSVGIVQGARRELVPFCVALIIAQLFFKWGSFSLELLGFIVTWWVMGFIFESVTRAFDRN